MKIITNTKLYGKLCYVQVKDLLFLARYTGNKRLMQDYIDTINKGKSDNEFIKVSGDKYIKAFELCDYIIDFSEYSKRDIGVNYLSNLVKNKIYIQSKEKREVEGIDHKIDGVRDIIAYKNGTLDYKIPLVNDGRIEIISPNKKMFFSSSIIEDCFTIIPTSNKEIEGIDYQEFLTNCIDRVYNTLYPELTDKEYKTFIVGNTLVVTIKRNVEKKHKDIVGKILAKIKKTQD